MNDAAKPRTKEIKLLEVL